MDNAQKAIMIGVGLFITIIIISAVLLIVNLGTGLVDDSTAQLDAISSSLQGRLTEDYDGKIMTGARVLSSIREHQNSTSLCVVVANSSGTLVSFTGAKKVTAISGTIGESGDNNVKVQASNIVDWNASNTKTTMAEFTSTTGSQAINQSKQYKCSLIKTENGTVVGIAFKPSV